MSFALALFGYAFGNESFSVGVWLGMFSGLFSVWTFFEQRKNALKLFSSRKELLIESAPIGKKEIEEENENENVKNKTNASSVTDSDDEDSNSKVSSFKIFRNMSVYRYIISASFMGIAAFQSISALIGCFIGIITLRINVYLYQIYSNRKGGI